MITQGTEGNGDIVYTIVWTIEPGKTEEFKALVSEAVGTARELSRVREYSWFFSDDGTRCGLIEVYPDSASISEHLELVGQVIARMLKISKISRFDVLGKPDQETREAIQKMGARIYTPWLGFRR